ncbi:hypothetical protein [Niallia sp. 01092]|uniref:hypothetical protein n=1 Tax=unclassified Niallia TaxID=2837522 RepID=UPI003FD6B82C
MVKVYLRTEKKKNYIIPIPAFMLETLINIAFSHFVWKFINNQAKDKTVNQIYTHAPLIKEMLKTLVKEIKKDNWTDPLVDVSLKDGTYVKVEIS